MTIINNVLIKFQHSIIFLKLHFISCHLKYTCTQGGTIKPLVNILNIDKKREEQKSLNEELNENVIDLMMACVEIISGKQVQHICMFFNIYYNFFSSSFICYEKFLFLTNAF